MEPIDASVQHAAYLLAIAVGIVSSGLVGSAWTIVTGEEPEFRMILADDFSVLMRVPVMVFSAPSILFMKALVWFIEEPLFGIPFFIAALGWSFLQGVFILTRIFGLQ